MRLKTFIALVFSVAAPVSAQTQWEWDKAETEIRRLTPEQLRDVPERVRLAAKNHGCTVPQFAHSQHSQTNVVVAELAARGQADWAFLCSRAGMSAILVVWGGTSQCPTRLAEAPDRNYLEGSSGMREDGTVWRRIEYLRELHPGAPPEGNHQHQALYDEQGSKYPIRYFCKDGTWQIEHLGH